jgi:hypothetical protein
VGRDKLLIFRVLICYAFLWPFSSDRLGDFIDSHWISDESVHFEFQYIPESVEGRRSEKCSTSQERYDQLYGMCRSIASLGGKSQRMYEMALGDLERLISRLERPDVVWIEGALYIPPLFAVNQDEPSENSALFQCS